MIQVLSLYTGMGGFDLACKQVLATRTVMYVEKEPYAQEVLKARIRERFLDDAPIWPDVFTLPCEQLEGLVDLITAGFPCQPFSVAGRRQGEADERNLWPITAKVIGEIRPPFVLLENVPGLASPIDGQPPYALRVLGDLAEMGYDAVWGIVGARDAGAPHKRDRWWCLAYSLADTQGVGQFRSHRTIWEAQPGGLRHRGIMDDADSPRLSGRGTKSAYELPAWPPGPTNIDAWRTVLSARPELVPALAFASNRKARQTGKLTQSLHAYREETQPSIRGMAYGVSHRVDRIKALGNAIVPAQGALALRMLLKAIA